MQASDDIKIENDSPALSEADDKKRMSDRKPSGSRVREISPEGEVRGGPEAPDDEL